MASLEQLEKRVNVLEQQMSELRVGGAIEESHAERGARLMREAKASQPALEALLPQVRRDLGIAPDQPSVSIERLHQMMAQEGITGQTNEFSNELIAMRQE